MSRTLRFVLPAVLILALTAVVGTLVAQPASPATRISIPAFSTADLMKDPGSDYPTHLGNLYGTAHSSLTEITPANVRNLGIAWHTELAMPIVSGAMPPQFGGSGAMPLASKGTIFTEDTYDRVWATDGATGKTLWVYDPELRPYGNVVPYSIRGLAIGSGNVYLAQSNGVIAAIDGRSGHKVWSNAVVSLSEGLFFTAAPLYYDGMILTGTSGGDTGGRSVFFALDARTGKVLWRWNAIPAAKGDLGFETWAPPSERAWLGGGSLWSTPVVDPKLGFLYVSVGNPIPYVLGRPPGAEVPTNSIVALRIKTGEPVWQYQTIHHDIWDWDMSNSGMLMDFEYQGRRRNALIAVNKNGYAYVIDRSNGQPILPIPEVQQPQSKGANTWPTQPVPQGGAAEFIQHTIDAAPWQGYIGPDGKSPYLASDTNTRRLTTHATRFTSSRVSTSGSTTRTTPSSVCSSTRSRGRS